MQKILLVSILVSIALLGIIWGYVGDIIGDDMVNILSMVAAVAILLLTVGVGAKYVNQMKTDKAGGQLADHSWDGIQEYKNPIPTGWGLSFIGVIVWGFWYLLAGYPTWAYSQIGEWNEEVLAYNQKFESQWQNTDKATLQAMGESIFLVQCAPCHGTTAEGLNGKAANLTKRISKETVASVIKKGSAAIGTNEMGQLGYAMGMMPDRNGIVSMVSGMPISDAEIDVVSAYVASGLSSSDAKGHEAFVNYCSSCHGEDGKGMAGMAPNLKEFDQHVITNVLNNGKKGNIGGMPAFKGRLTEVQHKAIQTYLTSIAN
jgi:cytochrome c oxidase cbb3-type subunit 3